MRKLSLRIQIVIIVTVLAIGLIGAIVYIADAMGTAKESIIRLNRNRLASLTDNLARRYGLVLNFVATSQIQDTALAQREELRKLLGEISSEERSKAPDSHVGFYHSILNKELAPLPHSATDSTVKRYSRFVRVLLQTTIEEQREQWSHHESGSDNFMIVTKPVYARGLLVGAAWTLDDLSDEFAASWPEDVTPLLQVAAVVGILLALFFVINLRNEVSAIQHGLDLMKGDIAHRLPTSSSELGNISSSINGLASTIMSQQLERETLQKVIQQKDKLASLGQLVAGVAHEIRTPIAAIKTRVQLWQRSTQNIISSKTSSRRTLTPESMTLVLEELNRIENIVRKLLFFSKARKLHLRPTNLHDLLISALENFRADMKKHHIRVRTELDLSDPMVSVDADEIREVILNLLTNAIEAMPSGGQLLVRTSNHGADNLVHFSVEDSGNGISPEIENNIFDPFFTTKETGTGLGLSIAYEIIRAHHGQIEFSAGRRGGACFVVYFPRDGRKR